MTDLLLGALFLLAGPVIGLGAVWADGRLTNWRILIATLGGGVMAWELGALILLPGTEHGGLGVGRSFANAAVYGVLDGLGVGLLVVALRALFKRRAARGTA